VIDVAILGAGAAGLFAAKWLKSSCHIIEHNPTIGAKIAISGGGRCNVTNKELTPGCYNSSDLKKAWQILRRFDNRELLRWIRKNGCSPVIRKKNQYFCPKSAKELIELLRPPNASLSLCAKIEGVRKEDNFIITTSQGAIEAKAVLVATGGVSFKRVGASEIGFTIAKHFGHTIRPLRPALVGFTLQPQQFWFKELSGISMRARVKVGKREFYDDILFAHRGISGPAILNASLWWERGAIEIAFLDSLPKLLPHKIISTQLPLPKRFVKAFLKSIGVEDKKVSQLGAEELEKLRLLTSYSFAPSGTFGYERAEVTKGGVVLDELDENLQSRKTPGLFFAGEVVDMTGELGGYNFQWAFSSAFVAAKGIDEYLGNR